jgi:hypothetical protein
VAGGPPARDRCRPQLSEDDDGGGDDDGDGDDDDDENKIGDGGANA